MWRGATARNWYVSVIEEGWLSTMVIKRSITQIIATLFVLAATRMGGSAQQAGITEMNLIPGIGDFEYHWSTNGTGEGWELTLPASSPFALSLDPGAFVTGQRSQRIDIGQSEGANSASMVLTQHQLVETYDAVARVGEPWTIEYFLKTSPEISGVSIQVQVDYGLNGSYMGTQFYKYTQPIAPTPDWTQYSFVYTPPINTSWFRFKFSFITAAGPASGTVWIDNVSMKNGQPFPPLVQKPLKTYLLYNYRGSTVPGEYDPTDNWVKKTTRYDGGRYEDNDHLVLYQTVRPDALNTEFTRITYIQPGQNEIDPGDILPYDWLIANHPEWLLRDSAGALIQQNCTNCVPFIQLDLGNVEMQQAMLTNYIPLLQRGRINAINWDYFDVHAEHTLNHRIPANYPTDAAWQGAILSFLQGVSARLRQPDVNVKVIANLAHGPLYEVPAKTWMEYLDGVVIELGLLNFNYGQPVHQPYYFRSFKWKFLSLSQTPPEKIVIMKTDGGHVTQDRRFGIASFLAGMQENSYLTLCSRGEQMYWHSDLTAPLGRPLSTFTIAAGDIGNYEAYTGPGSNSGTVATTGVGAIIKRMFENGLVLTNCDDTLARSTTLPIAYTDLDGNTVGPGLVTLPPISGMILIGQNPEDTTPPATQLTNPISNTTRQGFVQIIGSTSDDSGVARVDFLVDGNSVFSTYDSSTGNNRGSFGMDWDSKTVPNGTHNITMRVVDGYGNVGHSEPVTISVNNEYVPPVVTVTNPADGSTVLGQTVVAATATDNDRIVKVDFYYDGQLLGSDNSAPYQISWDSRWWWNGVHPIVAKAVDPSGNVGTSTPVSVNVNNLPPTVSVTSPTEGSVLGDTVNIVAAASSNNAVVTKVEFYVKKGTEEPVLLATDTAAPYTTPWTATLAPWGDGSYVLTAKAYDGFGKKTTSAPVSLTVNSSMLFVNILSPIEGAQVNGLTTVEANARGGTGGVTRVEFYANEQLIGTDIEAPYTALWDTRPIANGQSVGLYAKVFDTQENTVTSATVNTTVANPLPLVAISAPTAFTVITGETSITVAATSPNAAISRIDLLVDGSVKATANVSGASPYAVVWNTTNVGNGVRTVFAKAYDEFGKFAMSVGVPLNVNNSGLTVLVKNPISGAVITNMVQVKASVTSSANISKVEFYASGLYLGTDFTFPYESNWETRWWANGPYEVTAKGFDSAGSVVNSAPVLITVSNPPPTATITSPAHMTNVRGLVTITATAESPGPGATISRVEFYVDGRLVGSDTTAPFALDWDTTTERNGLHTLAAKAFNNYSRSSFSRAIKVRVQN